MSLSPANFMAKSIFELQGWFIDIMNHLSAKNYDNGDWIPVITGMTGTPTVTAWFQRFGIECNFTIILEGTQHLEDATISLPLDPVGYGVAVIHSLTDNSTLGTAKVDLSTGVLNVKEYFVDDETAIIKGFYKVAGI
jgi:hypothetical protein